MRAAIFGAGNIGRELVGTVLAGGGYDWAVELVDKSAQAVAELCADLTTALGLEAIAIGGSIGISGGYLERI